MAYDFSATQPLSGGGAVFLDSEDDVYLGNAETQPSGGAVFLDSEDDVYVGPATSAPAYDPNRIGNVGPTLSAEEARAMPKMSGARRAEVQGAAESGLDTTEDDGSFSGWLGNLWGAFAHNSAGRLSEQSTSKHNQTILRGYVDRDGKKIPLTELPDDELDYLVDSAGWNGMANWLGSFIGNRADNGVMQQWDRTEGSKIADPMERKRARVARAQEIARMNVELKERNKASARTELENRPQEWQAGLTSGLITTGSYMSTYMIPKVGFVVAGLTEGGARGNELLNDLYQVDENGNISVAAERDSMGNAVLKGTARGIMAPLIEKVGGEIGGKILGGVAKTTLGRIPLVRAVGERVAATGAGRALGRYVRSIDRIGRNVGLQSMPEEMLEEFEDQVLDAALGTNMRESEKTGGVLSRAGEAAADFVKPENLLDLAESMLLVQVLGGGVAALDERRRSKNLDKIIARESGLTPEQLKGYTLEEKWGAFEIYANRLTPEQVEKKLNAGAKAAESLAERIKKGQAEFSAEETRAEDTSALGEGDEMEAVETVNQNIPKPEPAPTAQTPQETTSETRTNEAQVPQAETGVVQQAEGQESVQVAEGAPQGEAGGEVAPKAEAPVEAPLAEPKGPVPPFKSEHPPKLKSPKKRKDEKGAEDAEEQEILPSFVLEDAEADAEAKRMDDAKANAAREEAATPEPLPETPAPAPAPAPAPTNRLKNAKGEDPTQAKPAETLVEAPRNAPAAEKPITPAEPAEAPRAQETANPAIPAGASDAFAKTLPRILEMEAEVERQGKDASTEEYGRLYTQHLLAARKLAKEAGVEKEYDSWLRARFTNPAPAVDNKPAEGYNTSPSDEQKGNPDATAEQTQESREGEGDEFLRVQEESRRLSPEELRLYRSGSKTLFREQGDGRGETSEVEGDDRGGRVARGLRTRVERANSGRGLDGVRTILVHDKKAEKTTPFKFGRVDGETFRDVFEVARTYLKNGELVDLHDSYGPDVKCFLSEDGLCGFAVEPNGNLISVFSHHPGSLRAMKGAILDAGATHLDAYNSKKQELASIYKKVLGFETASEMDYNMEYDHDDIAANHGSPKIAFMVRPQEGVAVERKSFGKDDYDAAVAHQKAQLERKAPPKLRTQTEADAANATANVAAKPQAKDETKKGRPRKTEVEKLQDSIKRNAEKAKAIRDKLVADNPGAPLDPKAFRYSQNNKGGLRLSELQQLEEFAEDGWHKELGLAEAEAEALLDAVKRARLEQNLSSSNKLRKANETGQATYEQSAIKALERMEKHPNSMKSLAIAYQQVSAAHETAQRMGNKESEAFWEGRLAALNDKVHELSVTNVRKFTDEMNKLNAKLSQGEKKGRVSLVTGEGETMDVAAEPTEGQIGTERARKGYEASRTGKGTGSNFAGFEVVIKGVEGDNVDLAYYDTNENFLKAETITADELRKRGEVSDRFKKLADAVDKLGDEAEGASVRLSKADAAETPEDRALRFAADRGYQKWLKGRKDAEILRQDYEREQAQRAVGFFKRIIRGLKARFVDGEFDPERDGGKGTRKQTIRYLRNPEGRVVGTWNRATNELTLYRGANLNTLIHEFTGHTMHQFAEQMASKGDARLLRTIDRIVDSTPKEVWDDIRSRYPGADEATLRDEVWAWVVEHDTPATVKSLKSLQNRAWYNRAWQVVKDAWKAILSRLGFNKADLGRLDGMAPKDALAYIDRLVSEGKAFGSLEGGGESTSNRNEEESFRLARRMAKEMSDKGSVVRRHESGATTQASRTRESTANSPASSQGVDDASYASAVQRGDMEAAGKMVQDRAKAVFGKDGITTDAIDGKGGDGLVTLYRSSDDGRTEYTPTRRLGVGVFLTDDQDAAELYDVRSGGLGYTPKANKFYATAKNILKIDADGKYFTEVPLAEEIRNRLGLKETATTDEIAAKAFEKGYDAVVIRNVHEGFGGVMNDVILKDGNQLKLADPATYDADGKLIPLSKRFDSGRRDIRYAASGSTASAASFLDREQTRANKAEEKLVDSNAALKLAQREIDNEVGGVKEVTNADGSTDWRRSTDLVKAKEKANGHLERKIREHQAEMDGITEELSRAAKKGISDEELLDDFNLFLQCRHAGERNKSDALDKGLTYTKDYYGGMGRVTLPGGNKIGLSENVAEKFIKGLKGKYGLGYKFFENAADKVYDMLKADLKERLDSGRLSQEEYDYYMNRWTGKDPSHDWKHYVPLKTDISRLEPEMLNSSTASMRRNEFMKAHGRGEADIADSPLAAAFIQREQGIRGGVRNELANVEANLAAQYNGGFDAKNGTIDIVSTKTDADGNALYAEIVEGEDVARRGTEYAFTFADGTKAKASGGRLAEDMADVHLFKRDGKLYAIRYRKGANGLGLAVARAASGENMGRWGGGMERLPKFTHWLSAMRTQYSPEFTVSNMLADHLEAAQALIGRYGLWDGGKAFAKMVASEVRNARDLWHWARTGEARGAVKAAIDAGLLTKGGVASQGFEAETEKMRNNLAKYRRMQMSWGEILRNPKAMVWSAARNTMDFISMANEFAEYSTRIGLSTALENYGVPRADAVKFARDATVNFNRKGTAMPYINGLYMFANASVQGAMRSVQAFADDFKKSSGGNELGGKKMRGSLTATLVAIGVAKAVIDHFLGDDDEREMEGGPNARNQTEYDRKHNVGVPVGGGRQIIPLRFRGPYAAVPYLAQTFTRFALGEVDAGDVVQTIVGELGDQATDLLGGNGLLNDMGEFDESLLFQSVAPTLMDPFVQIATGKDYKGDNLYRRTMDDTMPKSSNGKRSTPGVYGSIAQALNWASGGNENRKGKLDMAPETVKLISEFILGAPLRDLNNAVTTGRNIAELASGGDPEDILANTPFVRRIIREYPENSRRYDDAVKMYERDKAEYKKATRLEERRDLRREKPYLSSENTSLDKMIERVKEFYHLENGEVQRGRKWVEPKIPRSAEQKAKYRRERLKLQAKILKRLGE